MSTIFPTGIHHLGIAVRSLDAACACFGRLLGATCEGCEEVPDQKVRVAILRVGEGPGAVRLELIEPTADDSPLAKSLAARGPGLHHLALAMPGLDAALAALAEAEVPLVDRTPRRGVHGTRIAFLHPRAAEGVLVELCEDAPP